VSLIWNRWGKGTSPAYQKGKKLTPGKQTTWKKGKKLLFKKGKKEGNISLSHKKKKSRKNGVEPGKKKGGGKKIP